MLAACGGSSGGGTTKYTLTVAKTGSGTVTSSPAGITCGPAATCAAKFEKGESVTLSAATDTGSTFGGWSGGGCTGTAATCVVTVSADTTVTVAFNAIHPTLRVFAWGGGSTTPAPGVHSYNYGDTVTLTATADADHSFTGWSGAASGTTTTTVLTLTNDALVGARFWSGTPGASALPPAPGSTPVAQPSGDVGGLHVLDWAGYKAAFSMTFDDARSSQSWSDNYAQMKAEGIPMTFYVIPSEVEKSADRLAFWQGVAADGQEIGNHTVNHCNVSTAGALSNCAYGTKAADATAMQQLDEASAWAEQKLNVKGVFTMATPYGDGNWAPFAEKAGFIAVRSINSGTMAPNDLTKQFALTDSFMGKDYGGKGEAAADLNAQIDSARTAGGWTTALVHKWLPAATPVDGGDSCCQMAVSDMVTSLRYLKSLGDVWGDTVVAVASYWIGQDLLSTATPTTTGSVTTWHWTLPPNFPPNKYVRVTVTGGVLSQGGKALAWDSHGYYEVALDAGELTLAPAVIPNHTLTVTPAGAGVGTVTSSVGGIDCGATCTASLPEGTSVTLSAVGDASSKLASWSGGGCSGSASTCVVTLGADTTVTATFSPAVWALKFDGTTGVNQYVSSEHGVKLTFDIPTTNLTAGSWTVSFDYYLVAAAAPQYTSAQVQFSSGAPDYTANYYNKYGVTTGAWNTLTYDLSSMIDSGTGMVAGSKFNGAKSISILFPYETDGTAVTLYLKNISMTDGTTTPLSVVLSSSSTAVGTLGPGTGTVSVTKF
jgi:peptidoglycan/xylan/chitin deacetylase (PgdA/CDA1 family)